MTNVLTRGELVDGGNPKLEVFFTDQGGGGGAIDVDSLEFAIFERVTSPPALVQTFPATGRETVDVSALFPTGDKLATGHYAARYTVPTGQVFGEHVIKWFYRVTPTSTERCYLEEFQVAATAAPSGPGYCTIADLRGEGVPASISDAELQAAITRASQLVDFYTGQWFEPRSMVLSLDGRSAPTMFLGFPIVKINSVEIDDAVLLPDELTIYNRHLTENLINPDDRENPRLELDQPREGTLLYLHTTGRRIWPRGQRNIVVDGDFGYTDYDGTVSGMTPPLICHVTKMITIRELPAMYADADERDPRSAWITKLKTRDQEISYADPSKFGRQGVGSFTGDPAIDTILMQFRRPIHIGSTGGSGV